MPKFYISTSIAYVNARPHIGFAMEVIQADALARYHRLNGDDVFYLTGTDEHGMKLVQTAEEHGKTPQKLVDQNAACFKALKEMLNLSNNGFIRTTDAGHKKAVQDLWMKLVNAGDIYKGIYKGLYCVGCEAFITEKDLLDGKCPIHLRFPEKLEEENYFFKLSRYSEKIKKLIEIDKLKIVPEERKHEILAVLNEGLKDVSFSRPKSVLSWGIEVPNDTDQVMYVWCDALSNYISGIGYFNDEKQFKKFWPADVHLVGKDILRFHSAIWIGMLLSAGMETPHAIYVHAFITSEGMKMSKSLKNVVDPQEIVKQSGADSLRYYLLKEIPTTADGDFSKDRFKIVYDSELADNIGNLVSRVLAMTHKYFDGNVPQEENIQFDLEHLVMEYNGAINAFDLKKALEIVIGFADSANKFVEDEKPWLLIKNDQKKLSVVMYGLLERIRILGVLLLPFIPATAANILEYLGINPDKVSFAKDLNWGLLKKGSKIRKASVLFPKL